MTGVDGLADYIEHFRCRVLQDALTEATAAYWLHRAETFEDARHRPGIDYPGESTLDELRGRWLALTETAQACRRHATIMLGGETPDQVICPVCGTPTSPWSCSCGETRIGGDLDDGVA